MRRLTPDRDGVLVRRGRDDWRCWVSGKTIQPDERQIVINPTGKPADDMFDATPLPMVVSIGAIDDLIHRLKNLDRAEREIVCGDRLVMGLPGADKDIAGECAICGGEFGDCSFIGSGVEREMGGEWWGYMHADCIEEFETAVERFWADAPDILADQI